MTYAVADEDDNTATSDTATQSFTITTTIVPSCHTYDDPNFLLTYTPTLFLDATYLGRFNRFISRDGNHTGPDPELIPGDFYQVRFSDGSSIEIATNPDQISRSFGSELVEGFGRNLGSAPEFLRNDLDRLQISHVADPSQSGGGFWVTQEQIRTVNLYISYFTYDGELKDPSSWPWTKEVVFRHWDSVLIHELAHHFDIVDYRRPRPRGTHSASSGWAAAQAADGKHISEYAKTRDEEDFAETMKFYLPLRYMPERWCPRNGYIHTRYDTEPDSLSRRKFEDGRSNVPRSSGGLLRMNRRYPRSIRTITPSILSAAMTAVLLLCFSLGSQSAIASEFECQHRLEDTPGDWTPSELWAWNDVLCIGNPHVNFAQFHDPTPPRNTTDNCVREKTTLSPAFMKRIFTYQPMVAVIDFHGMSLIALRCASMNDPLDLAYVRSDVGLHFYDFPVPG